jgi:hypothetical protein
MQNNWLLFALSGTLYTFKQFAIDFYKKEEL